MVTGPLSDPDPRPTNASPYLRIADAQLTPDSRQENAFRREPAIPPYAGPASIAAPCRSA